MVTMLGESLIENAASPLSMESFGVVDGGKICSALSEYVPA